jgi:hypothetical protein
MKSWLLIRNYDGDEQFRQTRKRKDDDEEEEESDIDE